MEAGPSTAPSEYLDLARCPWLDLNAPPSVQAQEQTWGRNIAATPVDELCDALRENGRLAGPLAALSPSKVVDVLTDAAGLRQGEDYEIVETSWIVLRDTSRLRALASQPAQATLAAYRAKYEIEPASRARPALPPPSQPPPLPLPPPPKQQSPPRESTLELAPTPRERYLQAAAASAKASAPSIASWGNYSAPSTPLVPSTPVGNRSPAPRMKLHGPPTPAESLLEIEESAPDASAPRMIAGPTPIKTVDPRRQQQRQASSSSSSNNGNGKANVPSVPSIPLLALPRSAPRMERGSALAGLARIWTGVLATKQFPGASRRRASRGQIG